MLYEVITAYRTGRGRVYMRAKTHFEEQKNGKTFIVITELPYQVNKANMLEKILAVSQEKKALFSGIADIRDESDRTGIRVVIELTGQAQPQVILNNLYKHSQLQITYSMIIRITSYNVCYTKLLRKSCTPPPGPFALPSQCR